MMHERARYGFVIVTAAALVLLSFSGAHAKDPAPKPKDLAELRVHTKWKLTQDYKEGHFYFTLATEADGEPMLLISSKLAKDIKEDYYSDASYAKSSNPLQCCFGTYIFNKKKNEWEFNYDAKRSKLRNEFRGDVRKLLAEFLTSQLEDDKKRKNPNVTVHFLPKRSLRD
jgi:hypothetical protein